MATASPLEIAHLPLRPRLDEVPPELADNFVIRALLNMTPAQERAIERLQEASAIYGDDTDRELADLEAGRHPVQRART